MKAYLPSILATALSLTASAQQPASFQLPPPFHARAAERLVIRNAMVIYGSGRPAYGPADIVVIYEASRDVIRAQNQPWFKDYLHPSMEAFFRPSLDNHGSYFLGWTSTQEARWKRQFRIWMDAVREFGTKGGLVTTGDDAGYIYSMYGFGIARELELHEEAGFHPLEVIEHATWNGARMIGMEDRLGKVREGFIADPLVVNGNPLDNLKLLNPSGTDVMLVNGRQVSNYTRIAPGDKVQIARGGGIEWTIKDGIPYHVPTLMREVKDMVAAARRGRSTTP